MDHASLLAFLPNQTKPNQTKPNQTKPNQTKPNQTKPNQTRATSDNGRWSSHSPLYNRCRPLLKACLKVCLDGSVTATATKSWKAHARARGRSLALQRFFSSRLRIFNWQLWKYPYGAIVLVLVALFWWRRQG